MDNLDNNNVDKAIENFLHKVILTKTQYKKVISAVDSLKAVFSDKEDENLPNGIKIYIQGSFETRTTLRPITDIDEASEYDLDLMLESNCWNTNDPSMALSQVQATLIGSRYPNDKIEVKPSCVRIHYAEGGTGEKFHVDVVPILIYGGNKYAVVKRNNEIKWELSDPSKLSNWFNSLAKQHPTFRAQYLIIKRIVRANNIDIPSIILQNIVKDCYIFKPESNRYIRELLELSRNAIRLFDSDYFQQMPNPVNPNENLADRLDSESIENLFTLFSNIVIGIEKFSREPTWENLEAVFGTGMPKLGHESEKSLRSQNIYFDCDYAEHIEIKAECTKGKIDGRNYLVNVPADFKNDEPNQITIDNIHFTLDNAMNDYSVKWQVMNDPNEVEFQIRGDFYDDDKGPNSVHKKSEKISWAGNHWVRVYAMKNDRCKFFSKKFKVDVIRL